LQKFSALTIDPELVICLSLFHAAWVLRNSVKHDGWMSIPDLVLVISRATDWGMHLLSLEWDIIGCLIDIPRLIITFLPYNPIELV